MSSPKVTRVGYFSYDRRIKVAEQPGSHEMVAPSAVHLARGCQGTMYIVTGVVMRDFQFENN